jgi:O-antigen/teichoic acid export membrane protein
MLRELPASSGRPPSAPAARPAGIADLKQRALRGGFAKLCGQAGSFVFRLAFVVGLARLLDPRDFGLVAMVTAVTGVYGMFTAAGLSSATVQKGDVTVDQISTLFWINILIGAFLALLCLVTAPALVAFYGEPRLFWVTVVMASGFLVNAAGVQHQALLQRELRYVAVTVIEALSQVASISIGIGLALAGLGYWALVGAALSASAVSTAGAWVAVRWIPGWPRRNAGIRGMLHFGGTVTLNSLISYASYNLEKVLLGRIWGADALGLYGRAFLLISVPTEYLNAAVGGVAFSALSRLQDDPGRLRRCFLKGYTLTVSMTLPMTIFCGLFAEEIISLLLGPSWTQAAAVFRLLAPTVLIFGMINPMSWLLLSTGLQGRSLKIALAIAPVVVTAYLIGLPYGPSGVAAAYSAAMALWLTPHIVWCLRGTVISLRDVLEAIFRPIASGCVAGLCVLAFQFYAGACFGPLARLAFGGVLMSAVYVCVLLFVLGQRGFYLDLLRDLKRSRGAEGATRLERESPVPKGV